MEPSEQDASRASQHDRNESQAIAAASPRSSETESEPRPKREASAAAFGSPKTGSGHVPQKRLSEGTQPHSHGSYKKMRESREPPQPGSVTVPPVLQDAAQVRLVILCKAIMLKQPKYERLGACAFCELRLPICAIRARRARRLCKIATRLER